MFSTAIKALTSCPPAPVTSIDGGPDLYVGLHSRLSLVCRIASGGLQPRHLIWRKGHKVESTSHACSCSVELQACLSVGCSWSFGLFLEPWVLGAQRYRATITARRATNSLDQRLKPFSGAGSWPV